MNSSLISNHLYFFNFRSIFLSKSCLVNTKSGCFTQRTDARQPGRQHVRLWHLRPGPKLQRERVEIRVKHRMVPGRQRPSHLAEQLVAFEFDSCNSGNEKSRKQFGDDVHDDDDDDDRHRRLRSQLEKRLFKKQKISTEKTKEIEQTEAAFLFESDCGKLQYFLFADKFARLAVHRSEAHFNSETHFLGCHRLNVHGHGGSLPLQQHRRLLQRYSELMIVCLKTWCTRVENPWGGCGKFFQKKNR